MKKRELITALSVTAVYAVITLITVLNHETWADEVQVWQLCRNLSMPELFSHLIKEGHPVLFYLIVKPFASIFDDIICMQLICWIFAAAGVFLLMYHAPFKLYTKAGIIMSSGFLYFFPAWSRCYSIIPFLLFSAAILYKKSKQHPVIYSAAVTAAANVHAVMYVFCACLAAVFIFENLKALKQKDFAAAFFIIFCGFAYEAYMLINGASANSCFQNGASSMENLLPAAANVLKLFFTNAFNYDFGNSYSFSPVFNNFAAILNAGLFFIMFILIFKNNKKLFLCAFLGISFQLFIYIFVYSEFIYPVRIFCAYLIFIFCFWIMLDRGRAAGGMLINPAIAVLFGITFINGAFFTAADLKYDYAGAKGAAEFIQKNINPENSVILTDNEPYILPAAYYLRKSHNIYSIFRNKKLKYIIWDKTIKMRASDEAWTDYIKYVKRPDKEYYIINSKTDALSRIENTQKDYFDFIYSSPETADKTGGYRIFHYRN